MQNSKNFAKSESCMKSTKKANYAKSQCHCHCQLRSITCILWQTKLTSRSLVLLRFDLRFGEFVFLFGWIMNTYYNNKNTFYVIKQGLWQELFYFVFIVDIYNNFFFALEKKQYWQFKKFHRKKNVRARGLLNFSCQLFLKI